MCTYMSYFLADRFFSAQFSGYKSAPVYVSDLCPLISSQTSGSERSGRRYGSCCGESHTGACHDHTGVSRAFRSKNMPRFGEKKEDEKEKIKKPGILITSGKNSVEMPIWKFCP